MRSNHEDWKALVTAAREELSTALKTLCTDVEALQEKVSATNSRRRHPSTDLQAYFIQTHDWIKAEVAVHVGNVTKGTDTFPDVPFGAKHSTVLTIALDKGLGMTALNDIHNLLSRRVEVGDNSIFISTDFESASGRLHDGVLDKITWALFSGVEDENRLSPSSRCTQSQR